MTDTVPDTSTPNLELDFITLPRSDRPNRLCVVVSDLHFTDGTVGFQNLKDAAWEEFYDNILQRCLTYHIHELVLVLDGDVVDMIRSGKWAEHGVYPWERENVQGFSQVVNAIIKDIVDVKHANFFKWLRELETRLIADTTRLNADTVFKKAKFVVILGNHDKELLCDNTALTYFYEHGLGIKLSDINEERRRLMGHMYGDETMFLNPATAPYLPFYYGDTGFRFFTTHGQWRDQDNCAKVEAENDLPAWSVEDGWAIETWQKLRFSPFLKPCFGDSVAGGVLSTFIIKTKKQLAQQGYAVPEIDSVLDELDLYRPTYIAIERIIKLTAQYNAKGIHQDVIQIIEDNLYKCLIAWLDWDFTLASSPPLRRFGLICAKWLLRFIKLFGHHLHMKTIAVMVKLVKFGDSPDAIPSYAEMEKFPSFLPGYRHYGFQIHGEGHTHQPLQGELDLDNNESQPKNIRQLWYLARPNCT